MCGIVCVLQAPGGREPPAAADVIAALEAAQRTSNFEIDAGLAGRLLGCAGHVEVADRLLRGVAGVRCIAGDPAALPQLRSQLRELDEAAARCERGLDTLDAARSPLDAAALESVNA